MTNHEKDLKDILSRLAMEPYSTPLAADDTLVVLARMSAKTANDAKKIESRLLFWIEKVLQLEGDDKPFRIRISRPFILRDDTLRYTWDFTIKGDVTAALREISAVKIPAINFVREEIVETQTVKPTRGSVRPVTVGSSRK
ncbi:MAG: hypothetical protein ACO32I_04925 [Candidatus Limnocylindrus sp.]|jgi:hypothetical protein